MQLPRVISSLQNHFRLSVPNRQSTIGSAFLRPWDNPAMSLSTDSMRSEKRTVAANSVYAAVGITALKIVVGISTGSLGILSEAAHSGLDLVAAVITLMSV